MRVMLAFRILGAATVVTLFAIADSPAMAARLCRDKALDASVSDAAQGHLSREALKALLSRFDGHDEATRTCDSRTAFCIGRAIALTEVDRAFDKLSETPPDLRGALAMLENAKRSGQPWQLLALLGDLNANLAREEHDPSKYRAAAANLQAALNEIDLVPQCGEFAEKPPNTLEIARIRKRAEEAVMLSPSFQIARTKQGDCGGIFLSKVRGIDVESIPLPIKFGYNRADLTPEGQQAAQGLLQCVIEKRMSRVVLSGHTDAHGSDDYNLELSRRRLKTVGDFMKSSGYSGNLVLIPLGKREMFKPDDPTQHTPEELDEMNRRVELRETSP